MIIEDLLVRIIYISIVQSVACITFVVTVIDHDELELGSGWSWVQITLMDSLFMWLFEVCIYIRTSSLLSLSLHMIGDCCGCGVFVIYSWFCFL